MFQSPKAPGFICILSSARTGSTALRNALAQTGQTADFGEIFHTQSKLAAGSFLTFIEQHPSPIHAMLMPEQSRPLTETYLDYLVAKAGHRIPLIDIKHNAWSMLRESWTYPHDQPHLLHRLKERRTAFLFVRRRNVGDQIVSTHLAIRTGKWGGGMTRQDVAKLGPIEMSISEVEREARAISRAESLIAEFIEHYPRKLHLEYEDLFVDSAIRTDVWEKIAALTGIGGPPPRTRTERNEVRSRDVISNYREVIDAAAAAAQTYRLPTVGAAG